MSDTIESLQKQLATARGALDLAQDWLTNDCPEVKGYQASRLGKVNEAIASALSLPHPAPSCKRCGDSRRALTSDGMEHYEFPDCKPACGTCHGHNEISGSNGPVPCPACGPTPPASLEDASPAKEVEAARVFARRHGWAGSVEFGQVLAAYAATVTAERDEARADAANWKRLAEANCEAMNGYRKQLTVMQGRSK